MEKTKFINLIENLNKKALIGKWIPTYDKKLDYFTWTKEPLSKDAKLMKIARDIFLFFNPKGSLEGLAIEYLKSNFIEHNEKLGNFVNIFKKKVNNHTYTVVEKDKKNIEPFLIGFSESVRANIYKEILEDDSKENLESLFNTIIKSKNKIMK